MTYKILDIGSEDSFYEDKESFIGCTITDEYSLHPSYEPGYMAGEVILESPILLYGVMQDSFYFYSVKLDMGTNVCLWLEKEDGEEGYWDTGCGHSHIYIGGTPEEYEYKFCPYCGKPIKEAE
jgi:hypothetical protein